MAKKIYCALFMGQGGRWTSYGVWGVIAPVLQKLGCTVDVWNYQDVSGARARIDYYRKQGYKIVLLGYSLGTSTATYLQQNEDCDLLLCVAMSSLETTWPLNKKNVKRSVLWVGPDFLSDAGTNLGFNAINKVNVIGIPVLSHLLMPSLSSVVNGVVAEVNKL